MFCGSSNVCHSACVWLTTLELTCITNLDTLVMVKKIERHLTVRFLVKKIGRNSEKCIEHGKKRQSDR